MSLRELSSIIECWKTLHQITSSAYPPQKSGCAKPEVESSTPGRKHEPPFPYSKPWSFLGYEAFRPAKASFESLRKELPMVLNGTPIVARHDSSAGGNFISKKLASILHLKIDQNADDRSSFILGNGKIIESIGRVHTKCRFAQDLTTDTDCSFNVLPKMSVSLIMGAPFLEASETLSKNRQRLRDRVAATNSFPVVNLLESTDHKSSKWHFACEIDGRKTLANADSGSELDLVSPKYASKYGYRLFEYSTEVQLADTSRAITSGKILVTLGVADGRTFLKFFDVLPGLDSDVLLGEDTLEGIDAFTRLQDSFVDVALDQTLPELKIIINRGLIDRLFTRNESLTASATTRSNFAPPGRQDTASIYTQIVREESYIGDSSTGQSHHHGRRSQQANATSTAADASEPFDMLFLGGSPLSSREEFFTKTMQALAGRVRCIPDGQSYPIPPAGIIKSQEQGRYALEGSSKIYKLEDIEHTGHDDRAFASYKVFRHLKNAGVIPPHVRFQVSLPTPFSVVKSSIYDKQIQAQIEQLYETQLLQALQRIQANIPASDLTIQWDVLEEIEMVEGEQLLEQHRQQQSSPMKAEIFERLARLASAVDPNAEMGVNLCVNTASMLEAAVEVTNEIIQETQLKHHVQYVHLAVPADAVERVHFMPLAGLNLRNTRLFLGIIEANNEIATWGRLKAAQAVCPNIAGVGLASDLSKVEKEDFGRVLEVCQSVTS